MKSATEENKPVVVTVIEKEANIPLTAETAKATAEAVKPTVVTNLEKPASAPQPTQPTQVLLETTKLASDAAKSVIPFVVTVVETAKTPIAIPVTVPEKPLATVMVEVPVSTKTSPVPPTAKVEAPAPIKLVVQPCVKSEMPTVIKVEASVAAPAPIKTEAPKNKAVPTAAPITIVQVKPDQVPLITATPTSSPRIRRRSGSNIAPAAPDVPVLILTRPDRKPSKLSMSTKAANPFDDPDLGPPVIEVITTPSKPHSHPRPRRSKMDRFLARLACEPRPKATKRISSRRSRMRASFRRMVSSTSLAKTSMGQTKD